MTTWALDVGWKNMAGLGHVSYCSVYKLTVRINKVVIFYEWVVMCWIKKKDLVFLIVFDVKNVLSGFKSYT